MLTLREPLRGKTILTQGGAVAVLSIRQTIAETGTRRGAVAGIASA